VRPLPSASPAFTFMLQLETPRFLCFLQHACLIRFLEITLISRLDLATCYIKHTSSEERNYSPPSSRSHFIFLHQYCSTSTSTANALAENAFRTPCCMWQATVVMWRNSFSSSDAVSYISHLREPKGLLMDTSNTHILQSCTLLRLLSIDAMNCLHSKARERGRR
jgi:hypothetical protein